MRSTGAHGPTWDDETAIAMFEGRCAMAAHTEQRPPTGAGSVVSLWRYPVKSMLGEEVTASTVTERGLLGDRAYALMDQADGKVISAKNPLKWPHLFDYRAAFVAPPRRGAP